MFPAQITIHNATQLNAVMRALSIETLEAAPPLISATVDLQAVITKAENTVKADPKPQKVEKTKDEPAAQTAPIEPIAKADVAAAPEKSLSYTADIKPLILAAVKAGKRDDAMKVLTEFGVDHGEKLRADQFADAQAKLKKLVG